MTQYLLALETSGRTGSLALLADGSVRETKRLDDVGRRHAQTLVSEIHDLLGRHGLTPQDLSAVAVSRGPGSFTGLRVGIVCAKTFAYAAGLKLLAIDTFDAIAAAAPEDARVVQIVDDAQRGDLFVATFRRGSDGKLTADGPVTIAPAEVWVAAAEPDALVLGPAAAALLDLGLRSRVAAEPAQNFPAAGVVGRLAWERFARGEADDFWTAGPYYLRASAAEEKWALSHGGASPRA
ncbi:tRNA (adenosine(37)-N6)-threonylcarbamoyltransferase complex dimerization subunit type 1 TsaB [Planctellipticum variicoloris]|uniref:tRNA (adenosine(37)-N6)-threonylcarbamoyltransferase complex dimerization subunit type 1 TsaB n=1 Tax=Planctellipticum variicoloris TaxID=3064265 RepID=UPI003013A618|nr:tRNA (adenosine(37)-N6)-threonylcarbamoyltransferase complex dimerization subunit type 1 TsaB [Planctomycetaceae bacterium SH412]